MAGGMQHARCWKIFGVYPRNPGLQKPYKDKSRTLSSPCNVACLILSVKSREGLWNVYVLREVCVLF